jgi:xanthine dehydrogenase accessory factor
MMEVLREALKRARESGPQALATVVRTSGSTPRHAGARMVVGADAKSFGTIGGGRVELEAVRAGAEVAGGAPSRVIRHHLVRDLAMCCGGSMEVLVQPVAPSAPAIEGALALAARRRPGLLVSRLDGGAMTLEERPAHAARRPALDGDRFAEPILPPDRVILFGSGHVARALGPVLAGLGFELVVCDDNETGALEAAPPWAAATVDSFDLADVERALGPLGFADYLIITTRDHAIDQRILEQALLHPALPELAYLGLIGSQGKVGRFHKRLVAKGVASEERWRRLRAPIGLDIAAETPAEIAISVAAELVRLRNAGPADTR